MLEKINYSIDHDKRLALEDLKASEAHCMMLKKQKIISLNDHKKILKGLKKIKSLIQNNKFEFNRKYEEV